jgi:hypothetical protein
MPASCAISAIRAVSSMFCVERLARTVEHQRGKATVERFAAFLEGVAVIEMGDDRNGRVFSEMTEHLAKNRQRRVRPARRAGLQDHRQALGLAGSYIGAHVLPAERDQPRHRIPLLERRLQDFRECGDAHLNFATMSLMPGIVSIW